MTFKIQPKTVILSVAKDLHKIYFAHFLDGFVISIEL